MSNIAPVPSERTVTRACSVGVPVRLAQVTLSTCEPVVGAIMAVQCAGSFTASGQGCVPRPIRGVVVVVAAVELLLVAVGLLAVAVGVEPLLPPKGLQAVSVT